ncbi:hypothetical protein ACIRPU_17110 [Streptomyces sp. NPDC102259]
MEADLADAGPDGQRLEGSAFDRVGDALRGDGSDPDDDDGSAAAFEAV